MAFPSFVRHIQITRISTCAAPCSSKSCLDSESDTVWKIDQFPYCLCLMTSYNSLKQRSHFFNTMVNKILNDLQPCINYAVVLLKGPIQTKIQNKSITLAGPAINNVDPMTNQSGLFNSSKTSQPELVSSYR